MPQRRAPNSDANPDSVDQIFSVTLCLCGEGTSCTRATRARLAIEYNRLMGGLTQPTLGAEEHETNWRAIGVGIGVVVIIAVVLLLISRTEQKAPTGPPPYAANIKFSDLKMSAAENFVGATVSYIDGTVTNSGSQTVTHVVADVTFRDSMGQLAQRETVPLRVLQTSGPYPDAVDLTVSPLAAGQSKPFRLTFESISAQWNHEYPELKVVDVTVK